MSSKSPVPRLKYDNYVSLVPLALVCDVWFCQFCYRLSLLKFAIWGNVTVHCLCSNLSSYGQTHRLNNKLPINYNKRGIETRVHSDVSYEAIYVWTSHIINGDKIMSKKFLPIVLGLVTFLWRQCVFLSQVINYVPQRISQYCTKCLTYHFHYYM